jgi:hypothetical protein
VRENDGCLLVNINPVLSLLAGRVWEATLLGAVVSLFLLTDYFPSFLTFCTTLY